MKDMHELLSRAFPAPEDEPQPRDVVGAAMEWGERRRRGDRVLTGVGALAVVAVGVGIAVLAPGTGSGTGSGPAAGGVGGGVGSRVVGTVTTPGAGPVTAAGENCVPNTPPANDSEFCRLFHEVQNFGTEYSRGAMPYIQAALPPGFTVKSAGGDISGDVLILTGPGGKTNVLMPSVTGADTLDGRPPSCGTPPAAGCVQISTAGGGVVANGGSPSGQQSAGYVRDGLKDPRITILVAIPQFEGNATATPNSNSDLLLTNEQVAAIVGNPGLIQYSKTEYQHLLDIHQQLQKLLPPSATGSPGGSPGSPAATESSPAIPYTPSTTPTNGPTGGTPVHN